MARGKKKESVLTPEEKLAQALVPDWERPYKVPKNWCWTRAGSIAEVASGGTPSSSIAEYYENGDIPWISPADLSGYSAIYIDGGAKNITALGLEKSSARLLPKDTVCLSSRAPIGYVAIASNPLCTNQGFKNFLPSDCYLPKYLYWYLKGNKELLESYASGTTFLELSGSKAAMVEIPLAPITEQQRIVDRIEYLFSKLDEAKEKAQSVLDSFETRKAAILHKAFTGELTAKWRMENGVALENVEKVPLGKLTGIISSKRIYKEEYVETGVPFFRSSEVVELHDYGMTTPEFFISRQRYEEIKKQYGVPSAGDLLVTSVGTIGKTWIVDDREFYYKDGNLTQVMQCESLDMKYLQYFIKSELFKQQVSDTVAGSAYNALTIVKFKKILIPLVGFAEQAEIVRILDSIFAKEQQAREAAEAVLEKIDLLKKSILARAFRGELGTNDPTEESALELLKQVLQEDVPTVTRTRSKSIPKELQAKLSTELDRKIVKLYFKQETDSLPAEELLSVSSKKFEVMDSLHNLEQRGILKKLPNGNYRLLE